MIRSFNDKECEKLFKLAHSKKLPSNIQRKAIAKLWMLDAALNPEDLRIPPGNHFEALEGRNGVYSIRINNQWRITFSWEDGATNVKIEDYH